MYCKLPTNGKPLPAFPLKAVTGIEPRPQRWEARVLPLCHRGPIRPLKRDLSQWLFSFCLSNEGCGAGSQLQFAWKAVFASRILSATYHSHFALPFCTDRHVLQLNAACHIERYITGIKFAQSILSNEGGYMLQRLFCCSRT